MARLSRPLGAAILAVPAGGHTDYAVRTPFTSASQLTRTGCKPLLDVDHVHAARRA
jgi:hypothetical protein